MNPDTKRATARQELLVKGLKAFNDPNHPVMTRRKQKFFMKFFNDREAQAKFLKGIFDRYDLSKWCALTLAEPFATRRHQEEFDIKISTLVLLGFLESDYDLDRHLTVYRLKSSI